MRLDFSIHGWAAWAPGLGSPEAWRAWAAAPPVVPRGGETPPLEEVPALARRRVERGGRLAFQVAAWCQGEEAGLPLVFASRHGAALRSHELLAELARAQPLSPTSFVLSVHNAVAGQYSIIRGERGNVSAVSNGLFTVEAGVVEAVALLREAPRVVLVVHDASGPQLARDFLDEPDADFAFAWKLERGTGFSLRSEPPEAPAPAALPHALEVLRFVLGTGDELRRGDGTGSWRWGRGG